MNHTQEQLLKLLSSGVSNAVAAQALGITDSAVSQYLADTEFANKVAQARVDNLQAATQRDRKYDAMEDALLEKLDNTLPFMSKPGEILHALRIVNNAQRRGAQQGMDTSNQPQKIVVLNMPTSVVQKFTLNSQSEVVEVADKTMATLPSATLLKRMRTDNALEHANALEQAFIAESPISDNSSLPAISPTNSVAAATEIPPPEIK